MASTSAQPNGSTSADKTAPPADTRPQLAALEVRSIPFYDLETNVTQEDDEFEEFQAQDWDEADSELAHIIRGGKATSEAPVTAESLWDNSWDDDDVEAPFTEQLRTAMKDPSSGGDVHMAS